MGLYDAGGTPLSPPQVMDWIQEMADEFFTGERVGEQNNIPDLLALLVMVQAEVAKQLLVLNAFRRNEEEEA